MNTAIKVALIITGGLAAILLLAVGIIYTWPLGDVRLQKAEPVSMSYGQAVTYTQALNAQETTNGVTPDCMSRLHTHGTKTQKAVLMLHGYTACTSQFAELAQYFYDKGYNVYAPLAPQHGHKEPV